MPSSQYWKFKRKRENSSSGASGGSSATSKKARTTSDKSHDQSKSKQQATISHFFSSKSTKEDLKEIPAISNETKTSKAKAENTECGLDSAIIERDLGVSLSKASRSTVESTGELPKLATSTYTKLKNFSIEAVGNCEVHKQESVNSQCSRNNTIEKISVENSTRPKQSEISDDQKSKVQSLSRFSSTSSISSPTRTKSNVCQVKSGAKAKSKYTPLEQQFIEIKEKHPDTILFVECGYKYRFFGNDAEIAAKDLNIYCHMDHNFMTASIPIYRLFVHVRRLVSKGHKVGVVKQTETAALKAAGDNKNTPFTRELTALYTKSTLIGEDIDAPSNTSGADTVDNAESTSAYLTCFYESKPDTRKSTTSIAMISVQPSTGDIVYDVFDDDEARHQMETRISHIQPVEILVSEQLGPHAGKLLQQVAQLSSDGDDRIRVERVPEENFSCTTSLQTVSEFYGGNKDEEGFFDVLKLPKLLLCCLAALLRYLRDFHLDSVLKLTKNFKEFSSITRAMALSSCSIRHLEIFRNGTDHTEKGSLFWVLNHTKTKFGCRMLKQWISQPLLDKKSVDARLDAVEEVVTSNSTCLQKLGGVLKKLPDLEKGLCTIFHKKCAPWDFLSVCRSLSLVYSEANIQSENLPQSALLNDMISMIPSHLDGIHSWVQALDEKSARANDKTTLFNDESKFPEIKSCKDEIQSVLKGIHEHRREIRLKLGQPALEYMTVSGIEFLVEVKNAMTHKVPSDWERISSTKAVVRYHTPFILSSVKKLNQLKEQLQIVSSRAWQEFLKEFEGSYYPYQKAVKLLASLDCIFSLSEVALQEGFCRPQILADDAVQQLRIVQGKHPVVSHLLTGQEQFVPNDTNMQCDEGNCMVITGPNMGGKSSYIKQVALITLMAQMGSYVPAEEATISLVDGIYTRMGASDDIFHGRSTFMVELQDTSEILKHATSKSLVILDELGRGTSTHDGVAIAYATLKYLVEEIKCMTLFVTHYPPVAELEIIHPTNVRNFHMAFMLHDEEEQDTSDQLTFLYQLVPGVAGRSYGLNVARLAELPNEIIQAASVQSRRLEQDIMKRRTQKDDFLRVCQEQNAQKLRELINDGIGS